ncbi:MAG: T9SS type A sorting domain-containing protein [Candidatus Krumholzibacteriia bacterium]
MITCRPPAAAPAAGFVLLAIALLALDPSAARAGWLGGIDFSHPTPSHLPHGERVYVDIDYEHADAGGTRIFVVPLTAGGNTPGLATSPSGLVPAGTGTVQRWFTVSSGTPAVDQVRIRMTNADQSVTYFDFKVRVHYQYGPHGIFNLQINPGNHSVLANGDDLLIDFDWVSTTAPAVRIFARPWLNGSPTSGYTASGSGILAPSGSGSQSFTFGSQDATVNQVHFTMYNADYSAVLLEFDVAVNYWWRDVGMTNITFSKPSPASAQTGEHVTVNFDYQNNSGGDVHFWVLPQKVWEFPAYGGYSPSALVPPGPGSTSRFITAIAPGDFDGVQLLCMSADQSVTYVSVPLPADYHFGDTSVDNIVTVPERPAILDVGTQLQVTYDYHTSYGGNIRTWALPWFEGADVFGLGYAASTAQPTGSGTVGRFVVGLADGQAIDHLRFMVTNEDRDETLLDWKAPVTAFWSQVAATSPVPGAGPSLPVALGQNYPNPFNPLTTIPVELDATRHVRLTVYDLRGRKVAVLVDGMMGGGRHEIPFDGTKLASGQYIYRLEGTGTSRAMTLVK